MEQRSTGRSLESAVQDLIEIADEMGADDAAPRTKAALERYGSNSLNLVVFGEFKRGKSTLINALLGREVLPVGVIPLTALPTVIRFGADEWVRVTFFDGREERNDLSCLTRYVTEKENPENTLGVASVEVALNDERLRDGLRIIDTPGFGSTHAHNTAEAVGFLPNADAGVMILGSDPPIGESERDFLRSAREFASKFLLVQNKADQLSPDELSEALGFNQAILAAELGVDEVALLPVSARMALAGKLRRDEQALERSGILAVEERIASLAVTEKAAIAVASLKKAASRLFEDLASRLELEERLARLSQEDFEAKASAVTKALRDIRGSRDDALKGVRETVRNRLVELLEGDLEAFKTEEMQRLGQLVANEAVTPELRAAIGSLNEKVPSELILSLTQWSEGEYHRLQQALEHRLLQSRSDLAEITGRIVSVASETFGIDLPQPEFDVELPAQSRFFFRPWEMKLEVSPLRELWMRIRGRAGRNSLRDQALFLAWQQLEMHCGRLRYDYVTRLEAILRSFADQLAAAFEETAAGVDKVVRRAAEQRSQQDRERESASASREAVRQRLGKAKVALEEARG